MIEGTVHYYQNTFNMSMLLAQLSEYNDISDKQIIAKSVTSDIFLQSSNTRVIEKSHVPEDSVATITLSEEKKK